MAKYLLIFSVLGMCVAQIRSAAEVIFQPNKALSPTIANISALAASLNASNIRVCLHLKNGDKNEINYR